MNCTTLLLDTVVVVSHLLLPVNSATYESCLSTFALPMLFELPWRSSFVHYITNRNEFQIWTHFHEAIVDLTRAVSVEGRDVRKLLVARFGQNGIPSVIAHHGVMTILVRISPRMSKTALRTRTVNYENHFFCCHGVTDRIRTCVLRASTRR